ncbi:MAG TPA: hypothetical protein VFC42_13240 [Methylomirabilota bacterium]|jgi:acyl carrier protein|nr:hypothetical protein [Methylomirabilota bacterium]
MAFDPSASGDAVQRSVLAILARIAGPNRTPADPGPATLLAEGGFWLDSIDLLDLVLECDAAFGPVFERAPASAIGALRAVGDLVAFIEGARD